MGARFGQDGRSSRPAAKRCLDGARDSGGSDETEEAAMLILTRRVGETLMIGDDVSVTVLGVKGNQVHIGIKAPREVAVHREEIHQRIRREQSQEPDSGAG